MEEKELLDKLDAIIKINESLAKENRRQKKEIDSLKSTGKKFNLGIYTNFVMGTELASPSGDISIKVPYGEETIVSSNDMEMLFRISGVKENFAKGLICFSDENNYSVFGVYRKFNIDKDAIASIIVTNDVKNIISEFDKFTNRGLDSAMKHTIFYQIVNLSLENELKDMSYSTREAIEKYFDMNIRTAEKLYESARRVFG